MITINEWEIELLDCAVETFNNDRIADYGEQANTISVENILDTVQAWFNTHTADCLLVGLRYGRGYGYYFDYIPANEDDDAWLASRYMDFPVFINREQV